MQGPLGDIGRHEDLDLMQKNQYGLFLPQHAVLIESESLNVVILSASFLSDLKSEYYTALKGEH